MSFAELKIHLTLPAKFIYQDANHEGSYQASEREHGHRNRPQQRQGKVAQVIRGSIIVGLIIKFSHELETKVKQTPNNMTWFCSNGNAKLLG